ncbi:MAG: cell division protein ZipA [Pseudomonadota bacterium]
MNELRWILLGIGLVILALIYLFGRKNQDEEPFENDLVRHEPTLDQSSGDEIKPSVPVYSEPDPVPEQDEGVYDTPSLDEVLDEASRPSPTLVDDGVITPSASEEMPSEDALPEPEREPEPLPDKVIALHLIPKTEAMFDGVEFVGALQAEGLEYGQFDIFHRYAEDEGGRPQSQFSLANMIKPGTFSLENLDTQHFKGASLFLVLPGPEDAVAAFADMVATGRRLAATLGGQLLDSQGTVLSRQSASHLREDIINYQHGLSAEPVE